MFTKIFGYLITPFFIATSFLSAQLSYEVFDIDTLQTHSSEAIAVNNEGQILGWFNVDGSKDGKHFFVRDRDGTFHEIPDLKTGTVINWRWLKNDGNVYGTYANGKKTTLVSWNKETGKIIYGDLPGAEISAINDKGQVLIKAVSEQIDGKTVVYPAIWEMGKVTKLKGLQGEIGIEAGESFGFDMNNNGEVVGESSLYLSYKNDLYKKVHAVRWVNGEPTDLHKILPLKNDSSKAVAINDHGEILLYGCSVGRYLMGSDDSLKKLKAINSDNFTNSGLTFDASRVYNNENQLVVNTSDIQNRVMNDNDSIWMTINRFVAVNDNGEVIAQGKTIYGEEHAMFLRPTNTN